jgi:prephenate dehydrogenase
VVAKAVHRLEWSGPTGPMFAGWVLAKQAKLCWDLPPADYRAYMTAFHSIAILGPGLLGGSIAMAVRDRLPSVDVRVWARRPEAAEEVRALNLCRVSTTDHREAVTDADLVILCTPIGVMRSLCEQLVPHLSASAVVTDVGSVKGRVVRELSAVFDGPAFVGSHPMAGSEMAGIEAARADLFEGATCIVTPDETSNADAVSSVETFWRSIGGLVRKLGPEEHDRVVAQVSHLPHLVAAALVNLVCSAGTDSLKFSGSGFRDTTRVASGPAGMWAEILTENREHLKEAVSGMIRSLETFARALDEPSTETLEQLLAHASASRDAFYRRGQND